MIEEGVKMSNEKLVIYGEIMPLPKIRGSLLPNTIASLGDDYLEIKREVINARIGRDGTQYDSLGKHIRSIGGGLTTAQINALDGLFKLAAYTADASAAYAAFLEAFSSSGEEPEEPEVPDEPIDPGVTLTSISVKYSGGDVEVGTALTDLKGIVVTATYSDGNFKTVTGYTLSGTIAEGVNIITVSYGGLTATFTVTGVIDEPDTPTKTLTSISATYSGGNVPVGTAVSDLTEIVVTAHYSDGSTVTVTGYTLNGMIAEGSNTITVSYGDKTTTFTVTGYVSEVSDSYPIIVHMGILVNNGTKKGTVAPYTHRLTTLSANNTPKLPWEASAGVSGTSDYAPHKIPNNATSITIACPNLIPAVTEWTTNGTTWTRVADPGWMSLGGGTYEFSGNGTHFAVNFKNSSNSDFESNYDTSEISIVVS